jgi:tetratricopeptide (TPR) repeat protein
MQGMSNRDVRLALATEKVKETLQVDLEGTSYEVDVYDGKKLYYDDKGVLVFWEVTYPVDGLLFTALKAYQEAIALDGKGSNSKKIKAGLEDLQIKFQTDAYAAYNLHKYHDALANFEGALACSGNPLVGYTDTLVIYYAGLVARVASNNTKALEYFGKALELGYNQNGDLYAAQAEVLQATEDTVTSIQVLTEGLAKYPTNQSIIIGLINTFLQQGDDPKKILPYIEQAQQNDPDNASLYYAEGVVYEQMEDFDNAILAYKRALEKDVDNFYSNYSLGALYFNKAVQIQNVAAMEPDDKKYAEMSKDVDVYFDLSLPYLEHAYELQDSQVAVLESLKSLYFRLREKSPEMQQKYEYFNNKLQGM